MDGQGSLARLANYGTEIFIENEMLHRQQL